jgi:hypothetical protein
LKLAHDIKQFRAINRSERLALFHILSDVLDVDFVDPPIVKCRDDAVNILVILENAAEAKRLC